MKLFLIAGKLFIFKTLSAARKRIVISGLSSEQYHHRLKTYRDAIRSVEDVRQVRHKFIQEDQKLVFQSCIDQIFSDPFLNAEQSFFP